MAGLYIHVPFCVRKCLYCDFYSVPLEHADERVGLYLDSLKRELERLPETFRAETVYIGGGTPTVLDERALADLLNMARDAAPTVTEWTVEANPGTVHEQKVRLLREAGVTRVSLGAQSLDNETLRQLGRIHTVSDIRHTFELLRSAGFNNLGVDLMYGVPGQTAAHVEQDLLLLLMLRPEHVSCYALSFEPGTPFERMRNEKRLSETPEAVQRDEYDIIRHMLGDAGYVHYEISNFSLAGRECRHNIGYWQGQEYIGCGPGAHSHWEGMRWGNIRDVNEWARRVGRGEPCREFEERLSPEAKARETLILSLRLLAGVTRDDFRKRTGFDYFDVAGPAIRRLVADGWLLEDGHRLRLAEPALFVSNAIFAELV